MNTALIVAAGKGTRMRTAACEPDVRVQSRSAREPRAGQEVDKLFLEIAGRPVIAHTWQRFDSADCIHDIVMVVRDGLQDDFSALATKFHFKKPFRLVAGGKERQDSVWNGLEALAKNCEIVAIQDGARPCTSSDLIAATVTAAREMGAAVAAQRVTDTIKESKDGQTISAHLQRNLLWSVQTPQTFRVDVIRRALAAVRAGGLIVTDDTAACQLIGQPVKLIESPTPNPKVTLPSELPAISLHLEKE